jgi:hypothetical protein
MPGLRKLIDVLIEDTLGKTVVLPNRIVIPTIFDFKEHEMEAYNMLKPRVTSKNKQTILLIKIIKLNNSFKGRSHGRRYKCYQFKEFRY